MTTLLTLDEAGERLGIHPRSVYDLITAGSLGWTNVSTSKRPRIRVSDAEIERFISARSRPAAKKALSSPRVKRTSNSVTQAA